MRKLENKDPAGELLEAELPTFFEARQQIQLDAAMQELLIGLEYFVNAAIDGGAKQFRFKWIVDPAKHPRTASIASVAYDEKR